MAHLVVVVEPAAEAEADTEAVVATEADVCSASCCSLSALSLVILILHRSRSVDVDLSIFCGKPRKLYYFSVFPVDTYVHTTLIQDEAFSKSTIKI